jgi:hypothetical protein
MIRILAMLAALLVLFPVTACVTEMGGVKPSTQLANIDETTAGYALLSIGGPSGSPFITWGLKLEQMPNGGMVSVTFDGRGLSLGTKRDYREDDLEGAVFLVPLPPGEYAIIDYHFSHQTMPGSYSNYRAMQPLALRFTITPGKTTYLGEFIGMPARRALIGWSTMHGAYWWVRDQQTRDAALAQAKWPQRTLTDILQAIPDPARQPLPGFSAARLDK